MPAHSGSNIQPLVPFPSWTRNPFNPMPPSLRFLHKISHRVTATPPPHRPLPLFFYLYLCLWTIGNLSLCSWSVVSRKKNNWNQIMVRHDHSQISLLALKEGGLTCFRDLALMA
ncbi:hypothetical protein L2E82_00274 [Cichorium intybus]|uniref:Uncharacterized protein n=1 Tax=Cichorium intybus TaxID=13427 RepID=A0ACB9GWJ2_CICIN|nr:hypothetical protein L2E82_00274 [Cichorium intybus]